MWSRKTFIEICIFPNRLYSIDLVWVVLYVNQNWYGQAVITRELLFEDGMAKSTDQFFCHIETHLQNSISSLVNLSAILNHELWCRVVDRTNRTAPESIDAVQWPSGRYSESCPISSNYVELVCHRMIHIHNKHLLDHSHFFEIEPRRPAVLRKISSPETENLDRRGESAIRFSSRKYKFWTRRCVLPPNQHIMDPREIHK